MTNYKIASLIFIFLGAVAIYVSQGIVSFCIACALALGSIIFAFFIFFDESDEKHTPIADDVRKVIIKDEHWIEKYFRGEFDPEPDDETDYDLEETNDESSPLRKFVIRRRI